LRVLETKSHVDFIFFCGKNEILGILDDHYIYLICQIIMG